MMSVTRAGFSSSAVERMERFITRLYKRVGIETDVQEIPPTPDAYDEEADVTGSRLKSLADAVTAAGEGCAVTEVAPEPMEQDDPKNEDEANVEDDAGTVGDTGQADTVEAQDTQESEPDQEDIEDKANSLLEPEPGTEEKEDKANDDDDTGAVGETRQAATERADPDSDKLLNHTVLMDIEPSRIVEKEVEKEPIMIGKGNVEYPVNNS